MVSTRRPLAPFTPRAPLAMKPKGPILRKNASILRKPGDPKFKLKSTTSVAVAVDEENVDT